MPLSDKTLAEIEAGTKQVKRNANESDTLPEGYMDAMIRTHERNRLLRMWENDGKITVEYTKRYTSQKQAEGEQFHTVVHVKGGGSFTDLMAERVGGFPSEVLIAQLALCLRAIGRA
jgi:hypothetical protein